MKYFEKLSFTKEEKKGLLTGALAGTGVSAGLVGIETVRNYYHPTFKKYLGIAKGKKGSAAAIIGGSTLLGAGIANIKNRKK